MRGILAGFLTLMAFSGAAQAQEWKLHEFDDGSFFVASITPQQGSGIGFLCGERSPRGLSPQQTGNMEPDITPPGVLRLNLSAAQIGEPKGDERGRQDVMFVAGGQGWRLPSVGWNELFNTWEADLAANDAMFAALAGGGPIELHSRAGRLALPHTGFAAALGQLREHCAGMFASIAKPWPGASPAAAAAPRSAADGAMVQAAHAAIRRGCNGPAQSEPNYLLRGNIDGDGQEDVVLVWRRVTCQTGHRRPYCGASMCSADVFLSAKFPRTGQPENLLALGVNLQPLTNGAMAVSVGGSLASCQGLGAGCEFLFWWNGLDLVKLQ